MYTRRAADELSYLRRAAASTALLTCDEEKQLVCAARQGDALAFDRLVRSHLRLVFAIAFEYRRFGTPLNDLVAEGTLGLIIAARRFDPDRGARLGSYAALWIRALLRRFTLATRRIVGAPSTREGRALIASMAGTKRDLTHAFGAAPSRDLLAEHLGVPEELVAEVELALYGRDAAVSCSDIRERDSVELVSSEPSPESIAMQAERRCQSRALLDRGFDTLGAREREVVKARRLETEPPTLQQLGDTLGVSRERVRQLEQRGYEKLRAAVLESVA